MITMSETRSFNSNEEENFDPRCEPKRGSLPSMAGLVSRIFSSSNPYLEYPTANYQV